MINEYEKTILLKNLEKEAELFLYADFEISLHHISKTMRGVLSKTLIKKNSVEYYNLYVSCLLTMLNGTPTLYKISKQSESYVRTLVNECKHLTLRELRASP